MWGFHKYCPNWGISDEKMFAIKWNYQFSLLVWNRLPKTWRELKSLHLCHLCLIFNQYERFQNLDLYPKVGLWYTKWPLLVSDCRLPLSNMDRAEWKDEVELVIRLKLVSIVIKLPPLPGWVGFDLWEQLVEWKPFWHCDQKNWAAPG